MSIPLPELNGITGNKMCSGGAGSEAGAAIQPQKEEGSSQTPKLIGMDCQAK